MLRQISTQDIRHNLGEILDKVNLRNDQYIVARKGKPLAVIIPVSQFEKLQEIKIRLSKNLNIIKKQTKNKSEKELTELIEEAKIKIREK